MLDKIREKPDHIKHSLAIAITIVIFSCIVFVWWSSRDARTNEVEIREKTVSPVDGVSAMFDGFMSSVKERVLGDGEKKTPEPTSTTTDSFDISGVVIIDSSVATSTIQN